MKSVLLAATLFVSGQYYETISSGSKEQLQIAQCLAEKSTFYGAYWCDYCKKQKEEFGTEGWEIFKKSYVECSEKGTKEDQQKCQEDKIAALPAWKFQNGKTHEGYLPLEDIAKLAGCK